MEKRFGESMRNIKKIVLIGSESTGKTELAEHLAKKFNTTYIPEYAREYIEKLNRSYRYEDVINIALKQIEQEQVFLEKAHEILFYDTYLIITKIWLQHVFNHVPDWINKRIKDSDIDLFLLCNNDIEWKYDPARENPDLREYLFEKYKSELEYYHFNYRIISGRGEERFKKAELFVNELF